MSTESQPIFSENYRFLQEHVYAGSGIVLEEGKQYLFECRLAPIVSRLGLGSINELCAELRASGARDLSRQVVEAMTTNETYFFRDPSHFEAIRTCLLPQLRDERAASRAMRFWSAAASTGQEAYSLAMTLLDVGFGGWNVEILGTDIASHVVERARAARYQQIEVNRGLPAALLVKYFTRAGVEWQLNEEPRRLARFEERDLRSNTRLPGVFDLIFCRNVMIYFDAATRIKLIEQFRESLVPGGWLLVGGAETALDIGKWFERRTVGDAIVYVAR